jgi:hypothetical protein
MLTATRIYHRAYSGEDEIEEISADQAAALFEKNKRAKMERRSDGVYVFVIGDPYGYERVEIDVGRET